MNLSAAQTLRAAFIKVRRKLIKQRLCCTCYFDYAINGCLELGLKSNIYFWLSVSLTVLLEAVLKESSSLQLEHRLLLFWKVCFLSLADYFTYMHEWNVSLKLLTDVQLKALWDLICNPNNRSSCHVTHAWQNSQFWDRGSDLCCTLQVEPSIMTPGSLCTSKGTWQPADCQLDLETHWSGSGQLPVI